ncbi:MAG: hypothetical protein CM15mP109_13020 [Candidatus Dadabacteria bacterium]|nr:MAG: hypothetical protein CM15mP109_13020 [Candidatus Dadabacteria bacterium]
MSQSQLVDRILVNKPEADKAILNKAYIFGTEMHGRQLRASGDPYFHIQLRWQEFFQFKT